MLNMPSEDVPAVRVQEGKGDKKSKIKDSAFTEAARQAQLWMYYVMGPPDFLIFDF